MNLIIEILMFLYPMILLILFMCILDQILSSDSYKETVEVNCSICGIQDLIPYKMRKKLKGENDTELAKKAYKIYIKLLFVLFLYLILWIIYIGIIVLKIFNLIEISQLLSADDMSRIFACRIMNIMMIYWFFLTPIFEKIPRLKIFATVGYKTFNSLREICDKLNEISKNLVIKVVPFVLSFILLFIYLCLAIFAFDFINQKITLWNMLIVFLLYQYFLLKIGCKMMTQCKIIKKLPITRRYYKNSILYLRARNVTYLIMVFLYANAVDVNISSLPIPAALSILFLIDTYITQEENIQKMERQ